MNNDMNITTFIGSMFIIISVYLSAKLYGLLCKEFIREEDVDYQACEYLICEDCGCMRLVEDVSGVHDCCHDRDSCNIL